MEGTISENLMSVMDRINKAARKAGRDPGEVTLVAVTKSVETKKIKEAVAGGARVFGENYVQEAEEKIPKIKDQTVMWHFIGHLQKNKVKSAVELFDMIQTVDGMELAAEINKRAKGPIDILVEVNLAREKTKTGVDFPGAIKLARHISGLENLRLKGLMAIPPTFDDPEGSRPYFVALRRLAERINKEGLPGVFLRELSMGMSSDFEVAVEEGATMVRVGTAIFGPREAAKKGAKAG
ncbi:MAG: YggS family pyridoxal phosphate-dependent enzyme [Deltaproteobacteria bacterium]|nr:YggS family pyridoxal phosphate-dependent enzyme [Deltaproteobacteria bacterium]